LWGTRLRLGFISDSFRDIRGRKVRFFYEPLASEPTYGLTAFFDISFTDRKTLFVGIYLGRSREATSMFIDAGGILENLPNMDDSLNLVPVFSQKPFWASSRIRYPTNVSPSTHGIILVPLKKTRVLP
jgi:hypothetical protein